MLEAELYKLLPPTFQYIFEDILKGKLSRWSSNGTRQDIVSSSGPTGSLTKAGLVE